MLESGRLGSVTSLALCALICASAVNLALAAFAWAYVDPSVMTYTIQALAGVAVALSAVAGVAFRRGRRIVYQLLDIDEDARKQQEPDVHRVALSDGQPIAASLDETSPTADDEADIERGSSKEARNAKASFTSFLQRETGLGAMPWKKRCGSVGLIVRLVMWMVF